MHRTSSTSRQPGYMEPTDSSLRRDGKGKAASDSRLRQHAPPAQERPRQSSLSSRSVTKVDSPKPSSSNEEDELDKRLAALDQALAKKAPEEPASVKPAETIAPSPPSEAERERLEKAREEFRRKAEEYEKKTDSILDTLSTFVSRKQLKDQLKEQRRKEQEEESQRALEQKMQEIAAGLDRTSALKPAPVPLPPPPSEEQVTEFLASEKTKREPPPPKPLQDSKELLRRQFEKLPEEIRKEAAAALEDFVPPVETTAPPGVAPKKTIPSAILTAHLLNQRCGKQGKSIPMQGKHSSFVLTTIEASSEDIAKQSFDDVCELNLRGTKIYDEELAAVCQTLPKEFPLKADLRICPELSDRGLDALTAQLHYLALDSHGKRKTLQGIASLIQKNITHLKTLLLQGGKLEEKLCTAIQFCTELETLDLSFTQASFHQLMSICTHRRSSLQSLIIRGNKLSRDEIVQLRAAYEHIRIIDDLPVADDPSEDQIFFAVQDPALESESPPEEGAFAPPAALEDTASEESLPTPEVAAVAEADEESDTSSVLDLARLKAFFGETSNIVYNPHPTTGEMIPEETFYVSHLQIAQYDFPPGITKLHLPPCTMNTQQFRAVISGLPNLQTVLVYGCHNIKRGFSSLENLRRFGTDIPLDPEDLEKILQNSPELDSLEVPGETMTGRVCSATAQSSLQTLEISNPEDTTAETLISACPPRLETLRLFGDGVQFSVESLEEFPSTTSITYAPIRTLQETFEESTREKFPQGEPLLSDQSSEPDPNKPDPETGSASSGSLSYNSGSRLFTPSTHENVEEDDAPLFPPQVGTAATPYMADLYAGRPHREGSPPRKVELPDMFPGVGPSSRATATHRRTRTPISEHVFAIPKTEEEQMLHSAFIASALEDAQRNQEIKFYLFFEDYAETQLAMLPEDDLDSRAEFFERLFPQCDFEHLKAFYDQKLLSYGVSSKVLDDRKDFFSALPELKAQRKRAQDNFDKACITPGAQKEERGYAQEVKRLDGLIRKLEIKKRELALQGLSNIEKCLKRTKTTFDQYQTPGSRIESVQGELNLSHLDLTFLPGCISQALFRFANSLNLSFNLLTTLPKKAFSNQGVTQFFDFSHNRITSPPDDLGIFWPSFLRINLQSNLIDYRPEKRSFLMRKNPSNPPPPFSQLLNREFEFPPIYDATGKPIKRVIDLSGNPILKKNLPNERTDIYIETEALEDDLL